MRKFFQEHSRTFLLTAVLVPLVLLFAWVSLRSGPLAPVPVTLMTVERSPITPSLFGIGTVEARFTHKIGPIFTGRLASVQVQTGDRVQAGQLLGEMDPIDLDERIKAQQAALQRAEATVQAVLAQIREAEARRSFAEAQATRYARLLSTRAVSKEDAESKRQEAEVTRAAAETARANLEVARQETVRLGAERDGLSAQRANLRLVAPVEGFISRREADPGSTVIPGQAVVEVVEPGSIWVHVRFDQQRARGLQALLPARVLLRSQGTEPLAGEVVRIEPVADAVTEEVLAKVRFAKLPEVLPPIGELAEVTVQLAPLAAAAVVPNASVQRVDGRLGVWVVKEGRLSFTPVTLGASDLDGRVQILAGLAGGERVVVYSKKALHPTSRIKVVDRILGGRP